ncbi:MAG: DUF192 domain-containing protein [Gaiellaceae bacterium]
MATRSNTPERNSVLLVCDVAGRMLCDRCRVADRPLDRMRGLLGRRYLSAGEALLLRPAAAIHTAFMRFSIDAVFLDRGDIVLHVTHDLAPWRTASKRGARAVLELPAGAARSRGIEPGDRLRFISPRDALRRENELALPPRNDSQAELPGFVGPGAQIGMAQHSASVRVPERR